MRLTQAPHGDLRITFQGDGREKFLEVWEVCVRDQWDYPDELHDLRPYGAQVQEPYISVLLCREPEVLRRIKALMGRLEREYGMTVDDAAQARMDAWKASERPQGRSETRKETKTKLVQGAFPECCAACKYRHMIKHGECKPFLLVGEAACE